MLACSTALVACGGLDAPTTLDGATRPIAVFAPSLLAERQAASFSDDPGNPGKFSSYTWHLNTMAPWTDVVAFYQREWPNASRVEDDNSVTLRDPPLAPSQSPLREGVSVTIHKAKSGERTEFEITEDVLAEKRP